MNLSRIMAGVFIICAGLVQTIDVQRAILCVLLAIAFAILSYKE